MTRPSRYAIRFIALLATVTALGILFAPSSQSKTPYASALTMMNVGQALAAPKCSKQECDVRRCVHSSNATNCHRVLDPRTGMIRCVVEAC